VYGLVARLTRTTFFHQSGVLLIGQVGALVPAYLFSVLSARLLGPADFGVLTTSATLVLILGRAGAPLVWIVTNVVATFAANDQHGKLRYFVSQTFKWLAASSLISLALIIVLARPLSALLRLPSATIVILTLIWFVAQVMLMFARAIQQGLLSFPMLALNFSLESVLRLAIGLALLYVGLRVSGAIVGYGLGCGLAALVAFIPLRRQLSRAQMDAQVQTRSLYRFSAQAVIAAWCFAILSNADFIAVKWFLPATDAGLYAAIQMYGMLALVGFSTLYTVMFSAVSYSHARGDETILLFKRVLAMVILLGIVAVALTSLLARPLLLYTVGADYAAAIPFLVWYMTATVLLSLVMVVNSFYLARREGHFIPWLMAGTGLLIILLLAFHDRIEAVLFDIVLVYGAIVIAYAPHALRRAMRDNSSII
jgi:O-antigen/teichoic acid export membrane protein